MLARILPRHLCGSLSWHRVFALAPRLTSAPRAAFALPSFTAYAEDPAPDNAHSARRRTIPLLSVSISSLPRRLSVFTYTAPIHRDVGVPGLLIWARCRGSSQSWIWARKIRMGRCGAGGEDGGW
ncbi:hypothetical protein B0H14DRAFT_3442225 [Mycena olivaceomarginata]|nr:hypothetical protein B0H14DRAFT_3442225 [Mycena olivaceomarginata]